ncbi:hypothetical protein [Intrasporangium sp.]|nr:hypothetical protein [Intrasporangium sp.]
MTSTTATSSSPRTLLAVTSMEGRLLTREWAPMLFAFVSPRS